MNASALRRQLLYYGYSDINDYLKDSPFNCYIYNHLLQLWPTLGIRTPILTIFNEIYYQCVNVRYDRSPGIDIERRYYKEESEWLGSSQSAELVLCFVWGIMRHKYEWNFNDTCFTRAISPFIYNGRFFSTVHKPIEYMIKNDIVIPTGFKPMPCPTAELSLRLENDSQTDFIDLWRGVTDDYNHNVIEWLVSNYKTSREQANLIQMIESSFLEDDFAIYGPFMKNLKAKYECVL